MKNLLKFTSVLMLSACFFLASCSEDKEDNMIETETVVKMRNFAQAQAKSFQSKSGEIESISNEVSDTWTSTVFKVVEGQMVPCDDCDINDFEITQVFLLNSQVQTPLYRNGFTPDVTHTFTGEDVIGIDLNYKGAYVRMSDIDVFSQSQDEQYSYKDELGIKVFTNESAGTTSVVYNFPIGSSEANPENSYSGLWMRIVLDFNQEL
tara:strand:+ start:462 stop:1082 length:621 start_codon:yes stop_codon:yes gene_type:complete